MNYFDFHCDTLYRMQEENLPFESPSLCVNLQGKNYFSHWYQCFAVWINDSIENKYCYYSKLLDIYNKKIKQCNSKCFKPILAIENCALIGTDISMLEEFKAQNVFYITLTWNGENQIAGGVNSNVGLKPFGIDVIKEMNNLNIVCDLSHLNKKSFYSAVNIAENVIASHSCVNDINIHKRNLTLEQMRLINEKNGIIGLSLYPEFLGTTDIFGGFYKNLYFCLENGFENNVAVGSDFDGAEIPFNLSKINRLYNYLQAKHIDDITLEKIFYKNAYNYYNSLLLNC